jgi:hypothetical protein
MAKKKRRLIDQIYNGAFENYEFSKSSRSTVYNCGFIIGLGLLAAVSIVKKSK